MCDSPKYIPNRRLDYKANLHAPYVLVSCGKCPSCVQQRKEDYANRAAFEMLKYVGPSNNLGGHGIFMLYTYNDQHVPHLTYNGQTTMCFNLTHIYDMIKKLKDKFVHKGNGQFSYLIGPEFGVDSNHTQRPHYHVLFMLSKEIDPNDFADFSERIWRGQTLSYKLKGTQKIPQSWRHGNLGLVFPFRGERLVGKHLCRNNGACAAYAAKYATKDVGFYNNEIIRQSLANKQFKSEHIRNYPRVICSQRFGFNMLDQPSTDLVKGEVLNPLRNRVTKIPNYIMFSALHKRVYLGRRKEEETVKVNDEAIRNLLCQISIEDGSVSVEDVCQVIDNCTERDEIIKDIKIYDTPLTTLGVEVKCKQLVRRVTEQVKQDMHAYGYDYDTAYTYVVRNLVYDSLPIGSIQCLEGDVTTWAELFDERNWLKVYRHQLYKGRVDYGDQMDDISRWPTTPMFDVFNELYPQQYMSYLSYLTAVGRCVKDRQKESRLHAEKLQNAEKFKKLLKGDFIPWKNLQNPK